MDDLHWQVSARWWLATLAVLAAGCVETKSFLSPGCDCPPKGQVYQVAATWQNDVKQSPDPTHGGALTPVLAGRLYLFGQEQGFPMEGDGPVVVELYNETTPGVSTPLERWELKPDTLKLLLRKDMIGWGYTLLLPWGSYHPEITQVRFKVCYAPAHGFPLFTENVVTINGLQSFQTGSSKTPVPQVMKAAPPAATSAPPAGASAPTPAAPAPAAQEAAPKVPPVEKAAPLRSPELKRP